MTLLQMSLRSVLRGKRVVAVAVLPLVLAAFALVLRLTAGGEDRTAGYGVIAGELLVLVLGLVALVLGVNAFGDDRDERTLGLLLATTLPRWRIAGAKYVAAAGVTWVACLPAVLGCLVLLPATDLPFGQAAGTLLLASLLGAAAYTGLFVLLSLALRRAVLVGLAYLVLWEGLLAGTTTLFRNLSVGAYASRVAGSPFRDPPFEVADVGAVVAAALLLGFTAAVVGTAAWRLPRAHL
ncbi:MAG: hypothetical protein JWN57_709 [Frankiales bacterium]|jgi:ABC-2 type transport system permease protein|nr:hypothetical protein [Frankiales bacterium]